MTTVTTRTVEYPADGLTMVGHLAVPAGVDRRPAVLVGPEGPGLNDFQLQRRDHQRRRVRILRQLHENP